MLGVRAPSAPGAATAAGRRRPHRLAQAAQRHLQGAGHRDLHGRALLPAGTRGDPRHGRRGLLPGGALGPGTDGARGHLVRPGGDTRGVEPVLPYMFEYDVDLVSFFRPVDCGDVPVVPGNNDRSHEYIRQYIAECLEGGAKEVLLRRRSFRAHTGVAGAVGVPPGRPHRLSAHRLPPRLGPRLGRRRQHQPAPVPRAPSTCRTAAAPTWRIWARATASTRRTGTTSRR